MAIIVDVKYHDRVFIDKEGNHYASYSDLKNNKRMAGQTSLNPLEEGETEEAEAKKD